MSSQTVKRLKHPVREYKLDRDGRHDIAQLLGSIPSMQALRDGMRDHAQTLLPLYEDFTANWHNHIPASLESSSLLCSLADIIGADTVIDVGCGFSSHVLRDYAAQTSPMPIVYSVDKHLERLGKLHEYLEQRGCSTENIYDWDSIVSKDHLKFDLIFHDMGDMDLRAATLPWVIDHLKPGGFALLDDMHKARYRKKAEAIVAETELHLYSMRELTLDKLGRFAVMLHRPA